jgi:hypothetical protein
MKQKVADGLSGNFCGVCPILKPGGCNKKHGMCFFQNAYGVGIILSLCVKGHKA